MEYITLSIAIVILHSVYKSSEELQMPLNLRMSTCGSNDNVCSLNLSYAWSQMQSRNALGQQPSFKSSILFLNL